MSHAQFPPQGTKCVDCQCCQATVYAGNDPLCWECDEGKPCRGTKRPVVDASAPEIAVPEPTMIDRIEGEAGFKIAKILAKKPAAAPLPDLRSQFDRDESEASNQVEKQEVNEEKPMPKKSGDGRGHRIDDATRAAIRAEDRSLTNEAVARKYGISGVSVGVIRREDNRPPSPAQAILPKKVTPIAPSLAPNRITISADITEAGANAYWASLSLEQKAAMIQLQMMAILERAQA